jgi:RimJ/RimL family protein N-acetyltransferase
MLLRDDTRAFGEIAPDWALKGWQLYDFLTIFGAAFGVPYQGGLAAVAWIYEACPTYDSIGVFTQSRYRRLGLGRAAARALINHIQRVRKKQALWTTQVANEPSVALARLLGFTQYASEMLYEWPSSL